MKDFFEGSTDPIAIEALRLLETRQFMKSAILSKLLIYLVSSTLKNEVPKEISIGVEVFDKDTSYDPANDSLVRVYVHKLRKKIDDIYQAQDKHERLRLSIPKGGYQVILESFDSSDADKNKNAFNSLMKVSSSTWAIIALCVLLLVSWGMHVRQYLREPSLSDTANQLWSDFSTNGKMTYVVLGDLYLFHYQEPNSDVRLLARNPVVNSDTALYEWLVDSPQNNEKITITSNRFLMQSSAYTLTKVTDMLAKNSVQYKITTLSDLDPKTIRDANFIYLGMYKSMGLLGRYFDKSNYVCNGKCYTSLVDRNDKLHTTLGVAEGEHIDYGMVVKLTRENSTQVLFLAGFSDTGIMQAVRAVTSEDDMSILKQALSAHDILLTDSFDVLFEVNGFDYSDYRSQIKNVSKIPENRP